VLTLSSLLLLCTCCSPSPKYYGHSKPKEKTTKPKEKDTEQAAPIEPAAPATSPISFKPPLKNFSRSRITSYFGERRSYYNTSEFHKGIDIKAELGERVIAAADGTVIFADKQSGFGRVVIIDHGYRFVTLYAHLSELLVRKGDAIEAGTPVGRVGRSGNATGVHLHFEIRRATKAVDPLDYL
jgi:murein DD-endopeptidase MepM/ murein hydrolase activator NlpD